MKIAAYNVNGVGNPQPGPKFDYQLAWFGRLIAHAGTLRAAAAPAILAGECNVVPANADIYNAWPWRLDAVLQPESRAACRRLLAQGWIDATRQRHPGERIHTFWVSARAFGRNAGFRMDFRLRSPHVLPRLRAAGVDARFRGREGARDHAPAWAMLADAT